MFTQDDKDYIKINYHLYIELLDSGICREECPLVLLKKVSDREEQLSFYAHKDNFLYWKPKTKLEGRG